MAQSKGRDLKALRELVAMHIAYVDPRYILSHVCVASAIINKEIMTLEQYSSACKRDGISCYIIGEATLAYFKSIEQEDPRDEPETPTGEDS